MQKSLFSSFPSNRHFHSLIFINYFINLHTFIKYKYFTNEYSFINCFSFLFCTVFFSFQYLTIVLIFSLLNTKWLILNKLKATEESIFTYFICGLSNITPLLIEFYYLNTALWGHKVYYTYGYAALMLIESIVITGICFSVLTI